MPNCISYSLFGYNDKYPNSLDFNTYLSFFSLNLRMAKLIYPNWIVYLVIDDQSYNSRFREFFDYHAENNELHIEITSKKELCMMMLYRLSPIFITDENKQPKYERVICRDIDSLLTYRERQAVQFWENRQTQIAHGITDSISHNISLLGGMCGFISKGLIKRLGINDFNSMVNLYKGINYNIKGADQDFLNKLILPKVSDSITEHYVLGMPLSGRSDCYNTIQDIELNIPLAYKESNCLINHIGQAGFDIESVLEFIREFSDNDANYSNIEKKYPEVFYWQS